MGAIYYVLSRSPNTVIFCVNGANAVASIIKQLSDYIKVFAAVPSMLLKHGEGFPGDMFSLPQIQVFAPLSS